MDIGDIKGVYSVMGPLRKHWYWSSYHSLRSNQHEWYQMAAPWSAAHILVLSTQCNLKETFVAIKSLVAVQRI